jgi:calcium-dependent protein kinase
MPNRLSGIFPFTEKNEKTLLENNKLCQISYPKEKWDLVSPLAKDLVEKMTEFTPEKRISAKDALKHEWFNFEFRIPKKLACTTPKKKLECLK